jgi:hypothetical protein
MSTGNGVTKRVRFVLVPFMLMLLIHTIFIQIQFIYAQNTVVKPVRVNGTITDAFLLLDHQPQVAAFGNNVYIAWVSHHTGNDDIYFTKSSDGGASFGKIINLSNDPGDSYNPHLVIDGKNVYVVWVDGTPGPYGNPDIFFRRSTNGGTTFDTTINISNNPGFSSQPQIAVSGSYVYVVWRDNTLGNEEIFFKRSINNGASFGSSVYLSDNSTKPINSIRPQIVANANNVYVVWSKGNFDQGRTNVLFKRSIDNGASFGRTLNISNNATTLSTLQKISVLSNRVYIVWAEGQFDKRQIFFKRSIDGGATFSNTTKITNATSGDSFNPQIAAANNNVYLLWQNNSGNVNKQLFFKRSIDGGATFGNTTKLSGDMKDSADQLLHSSGNNIYAIWDDNSIGNSQIFFKRSIDGGATFNPTFGLSNFRGQSQYPDITSFNDNIYAVWQDRILGNIGIYFKRIM